ncbi:MAG TPA: AAA family ATPase [Candidatus Competibacteraceae bacterium]|nr:AAA family ATPase [Candidatus Competibacteraceae bacterium]
MHDEHDLELLIRAQTPILVIESCDEPRVLQILSRLALRLRLPSFRWTLTDGLQRLDIDYAPQRFNTDPADVLRHIRSTRQAGLYALLDFHPFLDQPLHVRLLKDIALAHADTRQTLALLSHALELPAELKPYTARCELRLPDAAQLEAIVREQARAWAAEHPGQKVRTDPQVMQEFVRNLSGLGHRDAARVARKLIYNDGAITRNDVAEAMRLKYQLLDRDGVLAYEYATASLGEVGGLTNLKRWLEQRRGAFLERDGQKLDPPRGILLTGVQGSGKSLAARAVAGLWQLPLLRLDFATLYNKYHGETERNLREALATAQAMAPCVLWMDELEKGISSDDNDGGTSRRVLGSLLTWLAENRAPVFVVATANDIRALPPELVRKGRLDEIFFVDLPDRDTRAQIFAIHLQKRDLSPTRFDLIRLAEASEGFSGAEIEQAVVAGLYAASAEGLSQEALLAEIRRTRPLSVVMAEEVAALRAWAEGRTVSAG